ncbi:HEXXH motif domain-containing protein [Sphaerisporangium rubeum]|uniref:HEXXH motif-containing protein n=1 Tax=Sphaerisporangium rubeum TaxID=321317 RepID=A0A7X0M499_9ACTN|nr:HEXXH motif-containing putative peptide modification protein [Sphaerisporangium rubeum]MBB6471050.1 HEXXH motif-containing protein [Sphaerisporangium rubeum]
MSPPPHVLPAGVFGALARGEGGAEGVRLLAAAERSKHLLLVRSVAESFRDDGQGGTRAAEAYALLADLCAAVPAAAEEVLSYPSVGLWALTTLRAMRSGDHDRIRPERLAALALTVAARAGTDLAATVRTEHGGLGFPSLGGLRLSGAGDRAPLKVRVRDGHLELDEGRWVRLVPGHLGWRPVRRLRLGPPGGLWEICLDDVDAYSFPPHPCPRFVLHPPEVQAWRRSLQESAEVLSARHPAAAEEVREVVRVLTPVLASGDSHASASAQAAFGSVAMSRPVGGTHTAVMLVHEAQHQKLNALMTMFDLVRPLPDDQNDQYYAPWRSDPRPFIGLFHGAYAHLGVTSFWRAEWLHGTGGVPAAALYARWRDVTLEAVDRSLGTGRFTRLGRSFAEEMLRVLDGWRDERVPADAREWALREARRHRAHYAARNR